MRVLMTADTVGGVWTFALELASGFLERGCDVCIVSFGGRASESQHMQCNAMVRVWRDRFRFQESEAPLEWMEANERAYLEGEPLLKRVAEEFEPDALLSSQFCFGAVPLAIPKIVVAHSDVLSWAECCRDCPLETSEWLRRYCELVARGLKCANAVVAPTRWMLQALARNFELPRDRLVVANGRTIPADEGRPRMLQAVMAGRVWDEGKNIAALRDVRLPLPLFIAGEASRGMPPMTNATCVGALDADALMDLFRESSVYICPSRYEPFGLAPLEAALCGCAIVANDIASLREVWEDAAIYFRSSAELEGLLQELCESPTRLRTAQVRSRERARVFTTGRMTNGYLQVLERRATRDGEGELCRAA